MPENGETSNEPPRPPQLHPGREGDKADFDEYLQFVNNDGLDEATRQAFLTGLQTAYRASQKSTLPTVWQPGSCKRTVDHYRTFKSAFATAFPGGPFRLMINEPQDHKWYEVDTPHGTVVIDPSGIPQTQEDFNEVTEYSRTHPRSDTDVASLSPENNAAYAFREKYRPYFGLKNRAPEFPQIIYGNPESSPASEDKIDRFNQRSWS